MLLKDMTYAIMGGSNLLMFRKTQAAASKPFCCLALLILIFQNHGLTVGAAWANTGQKRRQLSRGSLFAFDKMKILENRLAKLDNSAPDTLGGFFDENLASFAVQPGAVRLSVTSTCFAIQAIVASSRIYADKVEFDLNCKRSVSGPLNDAKIPLRDVADALLRADWRDEDLFQVSLILDTVLGLDQELNRCELQALDEQMASKIERLIAALLDARPKRREGRYQNLSFYLMFRSSQALLRLRAAINRGKSSKFIDKNRPDAMICVGGLGSLSMSQLPANTLPDMSISFSRYIEVSYDELCRQLAYRSAGDGASFDVIRLAYSLLTYVTVSNGVEGTAGYEVEPGEGPVPGTSVKPPNQKLVKAALDALFAEQQSDGLWVKGQPIYQSFRRTGRQIGNAFVFATDMVASLLGSLPADYFRPHMDNLERLISWIEDHQSVEMIVEYCDTSEGGQCYGRQINGWASPHLGPNARPEAWSTAQTLFCVTRMREIVNKLMHTDVLNEFSGTSLAEYGRNPKAWERLLDTDVGDPADEDCRTLKDILKTRVLDPFTVTPGVAGESSLACYPGPGAAYSAILFGPPGTAKSTICESVAEYMGWDFLVIDTSAFLADGLTNVASRIRYVFERLQSLENCIILFDEIEEFCLDRETPGLGMESRMLTTAMLTAINDLRRAKRSIFFLATNRLRAFDAAIIRPGRFDMQLFVGTPNLSARCIQFQQRIAALQLDSDVASEANEKYYNFMKHVWLTDAMFMNYLGEYEVTMPVPDIYTQMFTTLCIICSLLISHIYLYFYRCRRSTICIRVCKYCRIRWRSRTFD